MKKLTLEFVKEYIEGFGYKCLSEEYVNAYVKLRLQCSKNHQYKVNWHDFKSGNRCPICANENKYTRKLTIEYVIRYIEEFGYKCLSEEYIGYNSKLVLQCNKNHRYETSWSCFQQGGRCSICSGNEKKTIEGIKEYVEKFGYKCLSNEYVNNKTKLKFQCNNGHIYEVVWSSLQQGCRCPVCSNRKKKTIEEIRSYVEKFGYKCLSEEYISSKTKLKIQCDKGHIYEVIRPAFMRGQRCSICAGLKKKTIEEIRSYVEKFGYKCLSEEYINAHSYLEFQCNNNHTYKAIWSNLKRGSRCPLCADNNMIGEGNPCWKNYSDEDRKDVVLYKAEVMQLSNINYKKYFYLINPSNLRREQFAFHLDHIFSVQDGFNNGVPPEIIANPVNLQMLWWSDNMSKNDTSYMTLKQLYDLYEQFNEESI